MTDTFTRVLTIIAVVGGGLSAGVYLAFSTFIMAGIRRLSPAQAIGAFNGINRAAPASPVFMLVLFGTGLVCLALVVLGLSRRHGPAAGWLVAGAALVVISLLITVVYHVPHNNQ